MLKTYRGKWFELATYPKDSRGIVLSSGDGDEYAGCSLRIYGFGRWLKIRLPQIIKPSRKKVVPGWDAETVKRLGRDYYWDYTEREYGVAVNCGNHFCLYLGRQSHDSRDEQRWSCFLPWSEWKHIRWSGYGLQGEWILNFSKDVRQWSPEREGLPKAKFRFSDFDGEQIVATCHIEEREWSKGVGHFSWLRFFFRNKIRRDMDIEFSSEVGPKKGSWKGGTLGHGIDLEDGELHESAFVRYCQKHGLTFMGAEDEQPV